MVNFSSKNFLLLNLRAVYEPREGSGGSQFSKEVDFIEKLHERTRFGKRRGSEILVNFFNQQIRTNNEHA